jgi:hypothetical protein
VVLNVGSSSMPANTFSLSFFSTIAQNSHPMVVKRIWLYQIYYIHAVHLSFFHIADAEVKPLGYGGAGPMVELQI